MATTLDAMLVRRPGVCGGRLCIAGTRIWVGRIATLYKQGMNAEDIGATYQHLSPSQIHVALAYYHENREAVDRELAEEDADYERLKREELARGNSQA